MRFLQANMNRSKIADGLLDQLVIEHDIAAVIISEQYRQRDGWYTDTLGTAEIWIRDRNALMVEQHGNGDGFVWIRTRQLTIVSCYLTPNNPILEFQRKLDGMEDFLWSCPGKVLVAGDFNARAAEWGMPHTKSRGRKIVDMTARLNLIIHNSGRVPTFRRQGHTGTILDITMATEAIAPKIATGK